MVQQESPDEIGQILDHTKHIKREMNNREC